MTIVANYSGGIEASIPVRLTTTAITDIYTGTDKNSTAATITIANETGGAVSVIISYFDGTTNHAVFRKSVPANDTIQVTNMPMKLKIGDKVKATAGTANALTVTCSIVRSHPNQDSSNVISGGVSR